jgi:hypothetical protein
MTRARKNCPTFSGSFLMMSQQIDSESGNDALKGKLPGFAELKTDGAVYYSHF